MSALNRGKRSCSKIVEVICQIKRQKGVGASKVDQAPVLFENLGGPHDLFKGYPICTGLVQQYLFVSEFITSRQSPAVVVSLKKKNVKFILYSLFKFNLMHQTQSECLSHTDFFSLSVNLSFFPHSISPSLSGFNVFIHNLPLALLLFLSPSVSISPQAHPLLPPSIPTLPLYTY